MESNGLKSSHGSLVEKASHCYALINAKSEGYLHSPNTYYSYPLLSKYTNHFVDIMNGNNKDNKDCSLIDSPNYPHVFEFLNYVVFLMQWKAQVNNNEFVALAREAGYL